MNDASGNLQSERANVMLSLSLVLYLLQLVLPRPLRTSILLGETQMEGGTLYLRADKINSSPQIGLAEKSHGVGAQAMVRT